MAVLIEGISVVIQVQSLNKKYPGGWDAFKKNVPNKTLCTDNEIVRVGFMTPQDVESFITMLEKGGLIFLREEEAVDMCVVDQIKGVSTKCNWAEFGHVDINGDDKRVAAARLSGSELMKVYTPSEWKYDESLSSSYDFVPSEHIHKALKYLRHEDGIDVYLNLLTGREEFVGRTGES